MHTRTAEVSPSLEYLEWLAEWEEEHGIPFVREMIAASIDPPEDPNAQH